LLLQDQVRLSFALQGAKDNPEMESFNSRFKSENQALFLEAQTLAELQTLVADRMAYYNTDRRHSSLGYISPPAFIRQWHSC
jgi:transposase InsO family protein